MNPALHVNRWASAFIAVAGGYAGDALSCLKALTPGVKHIPGAVFGGFSAAQLEKLLRQCADEYPQADNMQAVECAIRFISLLVEKNFFRYIDRVIQKIEQKLNEQEGILDVCVESAVHMDSSFEEELQRMIKDRSGAAGIKMKTKLVPDLLGGYCLRFGGFCIDASLKGQLELMKEDLIAVDGGNNGGL